MRYDSSYFYNPSNGDNATCQIANCIPVTTPIALEEVIPVFEAGKKLAERDLTKTESDRKIFTYIGPEDAAAADSAVIDFSTANAADLQPYLGVSDPDGTNKWDSFGSTTADRVDNLINYVRGTDISGMRNRTLDGLVWRLGDIVHSTPIVVNKPAERFQQLYNDDKYAEFLAAYKDRETMIYVGANDGMLHAFTGGFYQEDTDGNPTYSDPGIAPAKLKGDEVWAYIPESLLPHLKFQALPEYSHTYYVDGEPRVFDAKIFSDSAPHYGGYGTLMVVGFGMGGKDIMVKEDFGSGVVERTFKPTYVLMDITEPRNPKLVWERTYDRLGFSYSVPAPVRVNDHWYLVFGSGPDSYDGTSTYGGYVYVVDMKTGDPVGSLSTDWLWGGLDTDSDGIADGINGVNSGYFTDPLALDIFQTTNADAIYLAQNYYDTADSQWKANLLKITVPCTQCTWDGYSDADVKYDDPDKWTIGTLFSSDRPISVKLNSTVDPVKNVLLFFGTGRYMTDSDKTDTAQQYLYGIKDPFYNENLYDGGYWHNSGSQKTLYRSDLFDSEDVLVTTSGYVDMPAGSDQQFTEFVQDLRLNWDGWYLPLETNGTAASERVITRPAILGGIVLTPTFTPSSDVCDLGGTTSLIGVYYETGTGYTNQIFDIDAANKRNTNVTINSITTSQEVVEIRDDNLIHGTPAPKVVFHVGLEGGATSKLQMSNRSEGGGSTNPALYFRSTITEWWNNLK